MAAFQWNFRFIAGLADVGKLALEQPLTMHQS
jgi:hypothetical protein